MHLKNRVLKHHNSILFQKSALSYFSDFLLWNKKNSFGKYRIVQPCHTSQQARTIPPYVPKPSYYSRGFPSPLQFDHPEIKDETAIAGMRKACQLARRILEDVGKEAKVDITTDELDKIAHELITDALAYPSPLNYKGFPKSVCTSVNNVVCHGIPDNRPLEDGDIVNIDVTVFFEGYHGDCSKTFLIGDVDNHGKRLVDVTELCLANAISACKPNAPFSVIGNIIEETAKNSGFTVLPAILGHGIGSYFHGPPEIYHFCNSYEGVMKPGNTFTIEPAISQGEMTVRILEDGWTVVTADEARTAQCEHTVLITDSGVEVLTLLAPHS